jgi:hypothetical protein
MQRRHTDLAPNLALRGVPELQDCLRRYGAVSPESAPYVVIGVVRTPAGLVGGLLAFADNEIHAHVLKRELGRHGEPRFGGVGVKRTARHAEGASFDVIGWRERVSRLPQHARAGGDLAELSELA